MVCFDVRNAFNTSGWERKVTALERLKVSGYLINLVQRYFHERRVDIGEGTAKMNIRMGVPQGLILGPLLWNTFYDSVL